ncbi:transglycosylase SLT domain-containing protein [Breznakiella homolactica]|uniref:Transglycosylase SLT domain-containing protein n=1 Tax=Breznakiella homolactica TaxID=2798577 RepID=A0A7T8BAC6_9SPIR|nr:transglycosylase SLT domain-containing protein [Breznakiella homolactica]QQO10519.1 lytic transglycosylase domain-containing protein [Breznakiella homolactica]
MNSVKSNILLCLGIFGVLLMCSCKENSSGESLLPDGVQTSESWNMLHPTAYRSVILESKKKPDPILESYRDETLRQQVIAFFGAVAHSEVLAENILRYADEFNISPSLAFALSWEESRFNPRAVNRNGNESIDRGLFQLNSESFPNLSEADFFDPGINTRYGLAHLRWCLDAAQSDVAGIAMYNAGFSRVRTGGTPKVTLDYVSRILEFRQGVEDLFSAECLRKWAPAPVDVLQPIPVEYVRQGVRVSQVRLLSAGE